jgi:hypothetical protein
VRLVESSNETSTDMAKRHKHVWAFVRFVGNALRSNEWSCKVVEACSLPDCDKHHERASNKEEWLAEVARLTCHICNLPNEDHTVARSSDTDSLPCVALLSKKVEDLEYRLSSLEDWRNR